MRDDQRRARFNAWFLRTYREDSAVARARFMADSARRGEPAYTKGRVSQLFDERQPFGERAASSLAQRFGLPADYFEHDAPESDPPQDPPTQRVRLHGHVVTDEEWALLQDVRLVMSNDQLQGLRQQAALLLERAASVLESRKTAADVSPFATPLPSVYTGAASADHTADASDRRKETAVRHEDTTQSVGTNQSTSSARMGDRAKRAPLNMNEGAAAAKPRGGRRVSRKER
jgi:hypothetical protein